MIILIQILISEAVRQYFEFKRDYDSNAVASDLKTA